MQSRLTSLKYRHDRKLISEVSKSGAIIKKSDKKLLVLIIDDHNMIRDGLKIMLETQQKYILKIDEAATGEEGVSKAIGKQYDIIILDYQLPGINGAETAKAILERKPNSKILALSNYNEYKYINNMVNAGVNGYVLKNIGPEELINAIESILADKKYYSNEIAIRLLNTPKYGSEERNKKEIPSMGLAPLSKREMEILKFIADDYTSKQIADKLSIGKRTVDSHRQNIMGKLKVSSRISLLKAAIDLLRPQE
jgi:DNA-binding NarL/FixJ family response regulator